MLFTFDFVCLVGAALRVRARRLTLKQYLAFEHVLVEIREGNRLYWIALCRSLAQSGVSRSPCHSLCPRSLPSHRLTRFSRCRAD